VPATWQPKRWLDELKLEGRQVDVVEHLIAPLVKRLRPAPSTPNPIELLRDMRDRAAAIRPPLTLEALAHAAALIRQGRAKLPANAEEIDAPLRRAQVACRRRIEHGDPRWEAWLRRWEIDSTDMLISDPVIFRRTRQPFGVDSDWPPASDQVERSPTGSFVIPRGTPEHAAWLCHLRRSGAAEAAQSADVAKCTLTEPTRWPPLGPAQSETGRAA
jgi:hypothetical protein